MLRKPTPLVAPSSTTIAVTAREDFHMIVRGLLVEGLNGEDFLLATEQSDMKTHRLVVLQRINGTWERLNGTQASVCRESLIGAFVDFIVDIGRVLNSSASERVAAITPTRGRSRTRSSAHIKPGKDL